MDLTTTFCNTLFEKTQKVTMSQIHEAMQDGLFSFQYHIINHKFLVFVF